MNKKKKKIISELTEQGKVEKVELEGKAEWKIKERLEETKD